MGIANLPLQPKFAPSYYGSDDAQSQIDFLASRRLPRFEPDRPSSTLNRCPGRITARRRTSSTLAEAAGYFKTGAIIIMRRISILCAAAGLAVTALAATSPAQAGFHVIRWHDTGFCQIWDNSIPTRPWPANYTTVTHRLPTFGSALAVKNVMLRHRHCAF
jgi:hypothetical protein